MMGYIYMLSVIAIYNAKVCISYSIDDNMDKSTWITAFLSQTKVDIDTKRLNNENKISKSTNIEIDSSFECIHLSLLKWLTTKQYCWLHVLIIVTIFCLLDKQFISSNNRH